MGVMRIGHVNLKVMDMEAAVKHYRDVVGMYVTMEDKAGNVYLKCWDEWDRWWNHSDVVNDLKAIGLESCYHQVAGEDQGKETRPTFFMYRKVEKPYHIDYAFLSQALLPNAKLEIGDIDTWLEHSDHMPVVVDINA